MLLRAFDLGADSQGTMNNTLFGTDTFGYSETICGGTGAGPGFDGTAAVQSSSTVTSMCVVMVQEGIMPLALAAGSGGVDRLRASLLDPTP